MTEVQNGELGGRAAVLVVDNQLGFAGVDAGTMNDIGRGLFMDVIEDHYDKVFVVIAHDRKAKDNEVVNALKQAASKYGVVDMYVNMHTNMETGTLAQVPLSAFDEALSQNERAHLRLLYNMGCFDGNEVSVIVAKQLGFKTFLGHEGDSASPLFAYQAIAEWVEGDHSPLTDWFFDLFEDKKLSEVSQDSYESMKQCLPKVRDELTEHWDTVQKASQAAIECAHEIKKSGGPQGAETVFACVEKKVPKAKDTAVDVLKTAAGCMPYLAKLAMKQEKTIQGALRQSGNWELPEEVEMAAGATKEEAKKYLDREVQTDINGTTPFMAGENIEFDEMPSNGIPPRQDEMKKLVNIVRREIGKQRATLRNPIGAAFSLAQMGATEELETLARDNSLPPNNRLVAILALMEKDAKYYSLFEEVLKEPKNEKMTDEFGRAAVGIVIDNLKNIETLRTIAKKSDVEFLRVEALVGLMGQGALTADELKDVYYQRGKYAEIAADSKGKDFLKGVALRMLMKEHLPEATPIMKEIIIDLREDGQTHFDVWYVIESKKIVDEFADTFYQVLTDVDRYSSLSFEEQCSIEDSRQTLAFHLISDFRQP